MRSAIVSLLIIPTLLCGTYTGKVLHISFHKGCINDFKAVGEELGLNLTSWFVLETPQTRADFEGQDSENRIYNMSHERAERIWNRHKEYFNQFDAIVTSDTVPLARIFLQNGWKKPLIVWMCNRCDYAHDASDNFPDSEFYTLLQEASKQLNVFLIPYTEYERVYAQEKGVYCNHPVIKPLGGTHVLDKKEFQSLIPDTVIKEETLFIYPRLEPGTIQALTNFCAARGIKTYSGSYAGPEDLVGFKGVIYVPYAWSNIALFENMRYGIVHFVPTPSLALQVTIFPTFAHYELSEWYRPEHKHLMIYFNSWDELIMAAQSPVYKEKQAMIVEYASLHQLEVLQQWAALFDQIT